MIVHRSNRIEALVDALAEVVAVPPPDPFAAEWITVQSVGMGRWLGMELARRLDVWANPAFPFPRKLIDAASVAVVGEPMPAAAIFAPETLRWAIAALLPDCLDELGFAPLRRYLRDDPQGMKRLQLAGRIADLFDQYAVYRPEMVTRWERGADLDWQAELWRALVRRHGTGHAAARAQAVLAALAAGATPGPGLPRRVSLFGLSTLPPLYVQILTALSAHVELHLFLLTPSREYWAETRSRREAIREQLRRGGGDADALAAVEGHPLLASFGRIGREFQHVLEGLADYADDPRDRCVDPGHGSMLAALQSDILRLYARGEDERLTLRPDDDSIAVHACHGPMREIEVLHDQLVALFERDPSLQPQHVVVMTPAIDAYAPVIEAVFGSGGRPAIPFRIADRRGRGLQDAADAFLRALELLEGRLPASAVFDLLSMPPVRERFGIAAEELDRVRRWVAESGVRWGADAAHRADEEQPPCRDNTWAFGLDRLLLGYALPGDNERPFAGVLPYDDVEGADADLLGRFVEFAATLCRWRRTLREARHPSEWREALAGVLASLVASNVATAYQHQQIADVLEQLAAAAVAGQFTGTVELAAMRGLIERAIDADASTRGFLSGAVTCCELTPMRSIPFRVVCLVGLNDGEYPRARRPLGFDRMAERRQPGDRTPRDDDRYLFLEALLAARERLLITYVGQSISDNTALPPSVAVDELLDAIDRSFIDPAGGPARPRIVQQHPLQPFSPRYFGADAEPRLFSYAWTHAAGAAALAAPLATPAPFLTAPLPAEPIESVALDDLVRFFDNPTRWFLQRRLGVFLGRDAEPLEDREPIEVDALDEWHIGDALLQRALRGVAVETGWESMLASGTLPHGTAGRCVFEAIAPKAARLAATAAALRAGERLAAEEIDLAVAGVRLVGVLQEVWPGGQLFVQYAKVGTRRELGAWIRHLARCAAHARAGPTMLVGRAERGAVATVRFRPVAEPVPHLAALLRLFRAGLVAPLPFFSAASRAYAGALHDGGEVGDATAKAQKAFATGYPFCDHDNEYIAQLYAAEAALGAGDGDAAGLTFAEVAAMVYAPFFAHREIET